jgi:Uma2 family endonuclease
MDHVRRPGFTYMDLDDFEELLADKPEHEKWELIGGRVVKMMVGARWSHHRLVQNINIYLANRLRERGSPCRTYTETFWLKERFLGLAVFPDVMVHCGPIERDAVSLSDPVVLFEVVSPGSATRDRIEKEDLYRRLPSLAHYVLVERDRAVVDVLHRADERAWSAPDRVEGLDGILVLPALQLEIPLREIYHEVIDASGA